MENKRKFYETPEFKALNEKWKKKLERSGFGDIEHDEEYLKRPASEPFLSKTNGRDYKIKHVYYESVEEYYRLAGQFYWEHEFADQKEKLIWELHKDGMSVRDIVKELKRRHFKAYRNYVDNIIRRLAKEMQKKAQDGQE